MYIVSVLYRCCKSRSGCCKSRSECCICCNGYTRMFQMFHLFQTYVASVLSGCCKCRSGCCIYMHIASVCLGVSYVCCKCFIWMLHMFAKTIHVFSSFFWCLQVLQLFRTHVASVSYEYCKSRSWLAHVVRGPTCRIHLLQLLGRHRAGVDGPTCMHWEVEGHERSSHVVRWHGPSAWAWPRYRPTDRCSIGRPGASSSHDYKSK
jgi:hypothetical protein